MRLTLKAAVRLLAPQAALVLLALAAPAAAPAANVTVVTATPIAPMTTARMGHWQIGIPGGKVAVIGGHGSGFVSLSSAEVYDPATLAWTSYTMPSIHDGGALAKLEDGRYLIAGSAFDLGVPAVSAVTIFDPNALTFTASAPMINPRMNCVATTLRGASINAFSNWNIAAVDNNPTAPTIVTFDADALLTYIDTYHWNFGAGTSGPGTIALGDLEGNVLYGPWQASALPGQGGVPNALWYAEPRRHVAAGTYRVLDSDPATWSQNGQSEGRGFSTVRIASHSRVGHVLVAGAWYNNTSAATGEVYDPAANAWTATGPLVTPRSNPLIVPLNDGSAYLMGGTGVFGGIRESVEKYDAATNTFAAVRDTLFEGESGWTVDALSNQRPVEESLLPDGRFLFITSRSTPNETQLFTVNPVDGAIAKFGPAPLPVAADQVVLAAMSPIIDTHRGQVFCFGASTALPRAHLNVYALGLDGTGFMDAGNFATFPAWTHASGLTLLPDGRMLLAGGNLTNNFDAVADASALVVSQVEPPTTPGVEPVLHVRIATASTSGGPVRYRYEWRSDGSNDETPITQGPTDALEATLAQSAGTVSFDVGETWTVDVVPVDEFGIEGTPARATFVVGPGQTIQLTGWQIF